MSFRIYSMHRRGFAAITASGLLFLAAACSSSSSPPSAVARSSASSSAAGDPLAALTADQITAKAAADLGSAPSVHLAGQGSMNGQMATMNVTLTQHGCEWTLTYPGKGSVELIVIGSSAWMKADKQFWESEAGTSRGQVMAQLLDGRYAKMPADKIGNMVSYCSPHDLAKQINNGDPEVKGPLTVVDGQRALELRDTADGSVGYVSLSAHPEVLSNRGGKGGNTGQVTVTYNTPGTISPPPAGQVVDLSGLAGLASGGSAL